MAEYSPSKIVKDGNTYNFRDTTKIPLAGSNAISGSLIPATTNAYDLGGPSYQWNNAYIKSLTINGVACGDILTHNASEFVDVTGAQTINGVKTFSNIMYALGSQIILRRNDVERTVLPASIVYTAFSFNDKSGAGTSSRFGAVENVIKTNGDVNLDLRAYDFSTKSNTHTTVVLERKYDGTSSFYPEQNNTVNLGTSTNKWRSLNGINPGALSLPGMSYINLDTTNFDVTATTIGTFTPTVDGWAILSMTQKNKHFGIWILQGSYRATFQSVYHDTDYIIFALIPVRANVSMNIYCTADDIDSTRKVDWLRLFPCQGNV